MRRLALLLALGLAGCGREAPPPPGGLSAADNDLLNNAAEMLDASASDNAAVEAAPQTPNGA